MNKYNRNNLIKHYKQEYNSCLLMKNLYQKNSKEYNMIMRRLNSIGKILNKLI